MTLLLKKNLNLYFKEENEAIAKYFHLFHGERFSDLQTFMSLYPSRFREPMDLPSPEGKDVKKILFSLIFL